MNVAKFGQPDLSTIERVVAVKYDDENNKFIMTRAVYGTTIYCQPSDGGRKFWVSSDPTVWDKIYCEICGASPVTANCNNAGCDV